MRGRHVHVRRVVQFHCELLEEPEGFVHARAREHAHAHALAVHAHGFGQIVGVRRKRRDGQKSKHARGERRVLRRGGAQTHRCQVRHGGGGHERRDEGGRAERAQMLEERLGTNGLGGWAHSRLGVRLRHRLRVEAWRRHAPWRGRRRGRVGRKVRHERACKRRMLDQYRGVQRAQRVEATATHRQAQLLGRGLWIHKGHRLGRSAHDLRIKAERAPIAHAHRLGVQRLERRVALALHDAERARKGAFRDHAAALEPHAGSGPPPGVRDALLVLVGQRVDLGLPGRKAVGAAAHAGPKRVPLRLERPRLAKDLAVHETRLRPRRRLLRKVGHHLRVQPDATRHDGVAITPPERRRRRRTVRVAPFDEAVVAVQAVGIGPIALPRKGVGRHGSSRGSHEPCAKSDKLDPWQQTRRCTRTNLKKLAVGLGCWVPPNQGRAQGRF